MASGQMQNSLTCPHCGNECPYGVTVCRGCQAEITYGPTSGESAFMALLGGALFFVGGEMLYLLVGFVFGIDVFADYLCIGGLVFGLVLFFIGVFFGYKFANRIWRVPRFIRAYRH